VVFGSSLGREEPLGIVVQPLVGIRFALIGARGWIMKCYFYSHCLEDPGKRGPGVVSFVVPELNIGFRAKYMGTEIECRYAGLLALLEFADINPGLFKEKILQIYSDHQMLVGQVNMQLNCSTALEPFLNRALSYKKKFPYSLNWIKLRENPAFDPSLLA
jgi:hypothetical protein